MMMEAVIMMMIARAAIAMTTSEVIETMSITETKATVKAKSPKIASQTKRTMEHLILHRHWTIKLA
jgi:hypothetical protein